MRKVIFIIVFLMIVIGTRADLFPAEGKATRISPAPTFYLGPGDVLEISVWKDEALTKEVVVRPDGMISFPLIGQIRAGGARWKNFKQTFREELVSTCRTLQ